MIGDDYLGAVADDKAFCWHPFTRQSEWCDAGHEPLMLVKGDGVWLEDSEGRRYIDGNSSIWTNVHGHGEARISGAIKGQLDRVAHTSYLGFGHPLAGELARRLAGFFEGSDLKRTFFSDDGSTAVECALKMAIQHNLQNGAEERVEFVAFVNGYHGDTMGAASLGGVDAFFARFRKFGFPVRFVGSVAELRELEGLDRVAGVVIEPLVQGVNEVHVWPEGMLGELREFTEESGLFLILDEVMTGFGRTGEMFACLREGVVPDFLCLAKGLTGGYLPMAATMVRESIYEGFLGGAERAFYYGHSYTASQLGCAAALASLDVFEEDGVIVELGDKVEWMRDGLSGLMEGSEFVYEVRQCGMVAGVELRRADGVKFSKDERVGERVCVAARGHGLLTRAILDTVVVMPPLCISREEFGLVFEAILAGIEEILGS